MSDSASMDNDQDQESNTIENLGVPIDIGYLDIEGDVSMAAVLARRDKSEDLLLRLNVPSSILWFARAGYHMSNVALTSTIVVLPSRLIPRIPDAALWEIIAYVAAEYPFFKSSAEDDNTACTIVNEDGILCLRTTARKGESRNVLKLLDRFKGVSRDQIPLMFPLAEVSAVYNPLPPVGFDARKLDIFLEWGDFSVARGGKEYFDLIIDNDNNL